MDYLNESRKRLHEIEEEQRREKFLRWASSNVKCLRELNKDEFEALRYHYENAESWKKIVNTTFTMAMNNLNGNVDYSNDLEKNRKQADIALDKLYDYVKFLGVKHPITETMEMPRENGPKR